MLDTDASSLRPPSVEIELHPVGSKQFGAVVRLHGEHDIATAAEVKAALDSIYGDVLVDLSDCAFIDSRVIATMLAKYQDLRRDGHRLELMVPADNTTVARIVEIAGIRDVLTVRDSPA